MIPKEDSASGLYAEVEARLRRRGLRPTAQRMRIGMLLLAGHRHASAEQLLSELRAAGSRVSKATVYNTLKLFAAHGLISEVAVDPSRLFYDSRTTPHQHFYNEDTGELTDIEADELEIGALPVLPPGTEAAAVDLVIRIRDRRG